MKLLKYEFMDVPENSYNGILGTLVKQIRHCRSVPSNEISNAAAGLQSLQQKIQDRDAEFDNPPRNYIDEIMTELDLEGQIEEDLMEEAERRTKAMVFALFKKSVSRDNFSVDYLNIQAVYTLLFNGYSDGSPSDGALVIAKECYRSVSNQYGVVFIDLSN